MHHEMPIRRVADFLGLVALLGTIWIGALLAHAYGL